MSMLRHLKKKLLDRVFSNFESYTRLKLSRDSIIGKGAKIKGAVVIGNVSMGEQARIVKGVRVVAKAQVSIGRYTIINGPNTDINCMINPVEIGSFCSIARNVSIQEYNHNFRLISTYHILQNVFGQDRKMEVFSKGKITIGNDVWIGTQCIVTGGSNIGDGAVIGANSVVIGNIPAYAIAAGSPAKVIAYRFNDDIIDLLKKVKWWDWPLAKIEKYKHLFSQAPTVALLEEVLMEET